MPSVLSLVDMFLAPLLMGLTGTALFGRASKQYSVPGLLFHSIYQEHRRLTLSSIPASLFKSVIRCLIEDNYIPVTISEVNGTGYRSPLSPRPILLTFDDGCRSFMTHVLPLIEELKIKATVFPVSGYFGRLSTWDIMPAFTHLTKSELREISSCGHEIGSHGVTHADLTFLDTSDLTAELNDSKKMLEDITGKAVSSISFPYGSWNAQVWERAQEAGYRYGTIYRKHSRALPGLFPVYGVYRFDTPGTVLSRIAAKHPPSVSVACAKMMSHFAKGAPVWKFDKRYELQGKRNSSVN
jgi:peptidoglycan/xylan/chitin deacetylase (PgdA/CDA1 family)